jgi:D-glutamate cyclase
MTADPETILAALCDLVQEDVGCRGLRADPADNLITATAGDFAAACHSVADTPNARLAVVTGFTIPGTDPPTAETDGPLGALFLARALVPLGIGVALAADGTAVPALAAGLKACGLTDAVSLATLPDAPGAYEGTIRERSQQLQTDYLMRFTAEVGSFTHLVALERVGPNHTRESIGFAGQSAAWDLFPQEVPAVHRGRCHSMRGRDVTPVTRPAHLLFEKVPWAMVGGRTTIGVGDGGNEIGMGKVTWETVRKNVPQGGLVACRVPTDHLIVAGVSNWGAYALATGVRLLRRAAADADLYDAARERELLRVMVEAGPLVDGVTGERTVTVDGLTFERYAQVLRRLGETAG